MNTDFTDKEKAFSWISLIRVNLWLLMIIAVAAAAQAQECDPALAAHVYHPARLKMINACITVTGTIVFEKRERDGDVHVRINLDKEFRNSDYLNDANMSRQGGALVVEPVCVYPAKNKPAIKACKGFSMPKPPPVGTHVQVTGPLVLDTSPAHGWQEIHTAQIVPQ